MADYRKEQRNQQSGMNAKSEAESKQLKIIMDNRVLSVRQARMKGVIQCGIANVNYQAPNFSEADLTYPRVTGTDPTSNPPGWCEPYSAKNPTNAGQKHPHHHERGHLIGRQFGGRGILHNIVTMTDATNGEHMLAKETLLADYIDANTASTIHYKVTANYSQFTYKNKHGEIYLKSPAPKSITMHAVDTTKGGTKVLDNVNIDNGYIYNSHGCDWV